MAAINLSKNGVLSFGDTLTVTQSLTLQVLNMCDQDGNPSYLVEPLAIKDLCEVSAAVVELSQILSKQEKSWSDVARVISNYTIIGGNAIKHIPFLRFVEKMGPAVLIFGRVGNEVCDCIKDSEKNKSYITTAARIFKGILTVSLQSFPEICPYLPKSILPHHVSVVRLFVRENGIEKTLIFTKKGLAYIQAILKRKQSCYEYGEEGGAPGSPGPNPKHFVILDEKDPIYGDEKEGVPNGSSLSPRTRAVMGGVQRSPKQSWIDRALAHSKKAQQEFKKGIDEKTISGEDEVELSNDHIQLGEKELTSLLMIKKAKSPSDLREIPYILLHPLSDHKGEIYRFKQCAITGRPIRYIAVVLDKNKKKIFYERASLMELLGTNAQPESWPQGIPFLQDSISEGFSESYQEFIEERLQEALDRYQGK